MSRPSIPEQAESFFHLDTDLTRRRFLGALAGTGAGLAGLHTATQRAFGANPDGKPIVWRYDRYGTPATIRYVPAERYRRIQVYESVSARRFTKRTDAVNGLTLDQRSDDPTDLVLTVYVDHDTRSVRRALPNRVDGVPVAVEQRTTDYQLADGCKRRSTDFYDPLPANPAISTYNSDDGTYDSDDEKVDGGTLGVVCWNDNPNNPYKCYITAAHVATQDRISYADYLWHGGEADDGTIRTEYVGSYVTHSPIDEHGMDVIKYRKRSDTATPDVRGNADHHLDTLAGTWTHAGLTDRTTGGSLPVEFAGKMTCYATTYCTSTERTALLEYQANYSPNEVVEGDSGGPFLDTDGYLVGTFTSFDEGNERTLGPTAHELLDRMDAQLSNPTLW